MIEKKLLALNPSVCACQDFHNTRENIGKKTSRSYLKLEGDNCECGVKVLLMSAIGLGDNGQIQVPHCISREGSPSFGLGRVLITSHHE